MKTGSTYTRFIYILANQNNSALHIGSMSVDKFYNWYQRVKYQPKTFSAPYVFEKLVYIEMYTENAVASRREKELKALPRIQQRKLVSTHNAGWNDLMQKFVEEMEGSPAVLAHVA